MASHNPPQAVAAAASASTEDDDQTLARKWAALEKLTEVYGFDLKAAKQAIDVVGANVEAACSFILDSGLGQDKGGPVVPIDNCPHLEQHAKLSPDQVDPLFHPLSTTCSHSKEGSAAATGGAKVDVDDRSGACSSTENWLCLDCGAVRCSRYANGHGLVHWENTKASDTSGEGTGHCVALSLGDLSVWCYVCGAYANHPSLSAILKHVEELKFGNPDDKKPASK